MVLDPACHGLILSGAGTGKTRVLAYRVAHLIGQCGVRFDELLILTFTNKASREMRQRVQTLLGVRQPLPWAGTFHSIGRRFIERHPQESGWHKPFQIMDSGDQAAFIKRLLAEEGRVPEREEIVALQRFINGRKEIGERSDAIDSRSLVAATRALVPRYQQYERETKEMRLLDFGELILSPVELFEQEAIAQVYQQHFKAILIDEFQDTNPLQYRWLQLLSGGQVPLFAVGDDDQSIYGWRGADSRVLQRFSR